MPAATAVGRAAQSVCKVSSAATERWWQPSRGRTHEISQRDLILVNGKDYGYIIGLGVRPFYLSARKRGYYHVLAGPSTAGQLLTRLWRFFRGVPADLDSLYLGEHPKPANRDGSPGR